jgi:hypothetical protein
MLIRTPGGLAAGAAVILVPILAAISTASGPAVAADAGPAPFSAHYDAYWKNITVGSSDLKLQPDTEANHYVYTWTITAHGIFKIVYSNPVTQKSWLRVENAQARPLKYHGDDGSSSGDLSFDWDAKRVRGVFDKRPVDLALKEGTQDVMSIQIEVMLELQQGKLSPHFQILDQDEIKDFNYTQEGTARLRTELGELDTVVVASQRTGNNRILRMWFAPSLGYVPVQAERTRDGKLEFAMRIQSLQR